MTKSYYSPFEDASAILDQKKAYDFRKASGDKKGAEDAHKSAVDVYQSLYDHGYGGIADDLSGLDAAGAELYIDALANTRKYDVLGSRDKSDKAFDMAAANRQDAIETSDRIYNDAINVDPTNTGYGKNIATGYGIAADKTYGDTLGAGIDDANGNADSYASAQAQRAKADMVAKGYDSILDYYNSIAGQSTDWYTRRSDALRGTQSDAQSNVNADYSADAAMRDADNARRAADQSAENARSQIDLERYIADINAATADKDRALTSETAQYNRELAERQEDRAAKNDEIARAVQISSMLGYVPAAYADILGVPAGTLVVDTSTRSTGSGSVSGTGSGTESGDKSTDVQSDGTDEGTAHDMTPNGTAWSVVDDWARSTGGDPYDYVNAYYKDFGFSSQGAAKSAYSMHKAEMARAARNEAVQSRPAKEAVRRDTAFAERRDRTERQIVNEHKGTRLYDAIKFDLRDFPKEERISRIQTTLAENATNTNLSDEYIYTYLALLEDEGVDISKYLG